MFLKTKLYFRIQIWKIILLFYYFIICEDIIYSCITHSFERIIQDFNYLSNILQKIIKNILNMLLKK